MKTDRTFQPDVTVTQAPPTFSGDAIKEGHVFPLIVSFLGNGNNSCVEVLLPLWLFLFLFFFL